MDVYNLCSSNFEVCTQFFVRKFEQTVESMRMRMRKQSFETCEQEKVRAPDSADSLARSNLRIDYHLVGGGPLANGKTK